MLTEKQEAIVDYVRTRQQSGEAPPRTREIQQRFGYETKKAAHQDLRGLVRRGQLEEKDDTWALAVSEVQTHFELPIYGSIPAGLPAMNEQRPKRLLPVSRARFRGARPERLWGLEVNGDSMIGAEIQSGDVAVLERREPRDGEIVAALTDETGTTLKRLVFAGGRPVLMPANQRYRAIHPETELRIQGVLVGVIRGGRE